MDLKDEKRIPENKFWEKDVALFRLQAIIKNFVHNRNSEAFQLNGDAGQLKKTTGELENGLKDMYENLDPIKNCRVKELVFHVLKDIEPNLTGHEGNKKVFQLLKNGIEIVETLKKIEVLIV